MANCNPVISPYDNGNNLNKPTPTSLDAKETTQYRKAIGSLNYLAVSTRPDLSFIVSLLSRVQNNPTNEAADAAKKALRYLRGTSHYGIAYHRNASNKLIGYSDSDFGGCTETRRSTSGCIFIFAGGPVFWQSKRQPCVTRSTLEAEYVSLSNASREGIWLAKLIGEFSNGPQVLTLCCDNKGAKMLANNDGGKMSKHIGIMYHYIKEKVTNGEAKVHWVGSKEMLADALTKIVKTIAFQSFKSACMNTIDI